MNEAPTIQEFLERMEQATDADRVKRLMLLVEADAFDSRVWGELAGDWVGQQALITAL